MVGAETHDVEATSSPNEDLEMVVEREVEARGLIEIDAGVTQISADLHEFEVFFYESLVDTFFFIAFLWICYWM